MAFCRSFRVHRVWSINTRSGVIAQSSPTAPALVSISTGRHWMTSDYINYSAMSAGTRQAGGDSRTPRRHPPTRSPFTAAGPHDTNLILVCKGLVLRPPVTLKRKQLAGCFLWSLQRKLMNVFSHCSLRSCWVTMVCNVQLSSTRYTSKLDFCFIWSEAVKKKKLICQKNTSWALTSHPNFWLTASDRLTKLIIKDTSNISMILLHWPCNSRARKVKMNWVARLV